MNLMRVERGHHIRAFEIYYAQGVKRSYQRVAKELGVSASSVKLWSRNFNWVRRIAERDAGAAREAADKSLQSATEDNSRNRKIVTMALMKVAKAIADGKVRIQMSDLDRLIRLEQILSDQEGGGQKKDGVFRTIEDIEAYLETLRSADLQLLARGPDIQRELKTRGDR